MTQRPSPPLWAAWSRLVADSWEDGVVAGTGVVGAVLFGGPREHIVTVAHERFFLPANSRRAAPDLAAVLPEIRAALSVRDATRAADIVDERLRELGVDPGELIWTDPLAPVVQISWLLSETATRDYRREIPLDSGNVGASWELEGGGRSGIRIIARQGTEQLTLELHSDVDTVGLLRVGAVRDRTVAAATHSVDYLDSASGELRTDPSELTWTAVAVGVEPGTARSVRVVARPERPLTVVGDDTWEVRIAAGVPARIVVTVTVEAEDSAWMAAPESDATSMLRRSSLNLYAHRDPDEPVEELWTRARDGDIGGIRRAIETAYAAGRRNVIASTGDLPPTLQGVWQGTWSPAWSADYTMNGNLQLGGLASVLWTGTPELMKSLFELVVPYADHYRQNARSIYGVDGMLLPSRMTTHGHLNHFIRDYPHEFWLGNGPWFLRLVADYIKTTGDRSVLDDWAWTFAVEIVDFGLGVLRAGHGAISPSFSPENTPSGSSAPIATNATADIAALRDGLDVGAWFAELKGDHERASAWRSARGTLPEYRQAADGTLAEWSGDWPENVAHRHVSQLHGLWYEPDEAFEQQELRDAALTTIRSKIAWRAENPTGPPGRMEMAFGLTSLALAAATLGDADSAYRCLEWLVLDHMTAGLVTTHDAGAIFNLDASGGIPAVVAAMLLGSSQTTINLLPALPEQWPSGEILGLTARGAVSVDRLSWSSTRVGVELTLPAEHRWLRPEGTTIRLPWDVQVDSANGATQVGPRTVLVDLQSEHARLALIRI